MSSLPTARSVVEELITEASSSSDDAAKLKKALISCGLALSAAALSLIFSKAPGGIFLRLHGGGAPFYLYYGFLVVFAAFGFLQASFGYWVFPRDQHGWSAIGKTMLWVSILPLVIVAALGGFALLK